MPRGTESDYPTPADEFSSGWLRFRDLWLNLRVMWLGRKLLLWFVVTLEALACAQTQKLEVAPLAVPPFIFRIQRTRSDRNACAIVRGDGLFHVEQETPNRLEVAEGTLDDGELAALKTVLGNKDLAALTQQKIPVPLIPIPPMFSERDVLQISILRSSFTQNAAFPDRESRRPFDEFVDALLHWMDLLQKHPRTKLDEYSARNNCLPPREIEFSPRPAQKRGGEEPVSKAPEPESLAPAAAPAMSAPAPFLMRWQFNHILNWAMADTCVVVYPSGRFRMEKSSQSYHEEFTVRAFESSLSESELQQLQELLNEPMLEASTHQNLPTEKIVREGEFTALAVSRDGRTQQLSFANYLSDPVVASRFSVGRDADPEERLVKPLRKWLKSHIETRKLQALPKAAATRCIASPQTK
jgi:hypothetical protein